jgi:hypothetical protein
MDEKTVDYALFLGSTDAITKQMTITHNKFMKRIDVETPELYSYCMGLCSMAKYLQANKHIKSAIMPVWYVGDKSCNCYLFEVLMRCNQYMSRVVDLVHESKEFHSYLETATNGAVLAGKMACSVVPTQYHEIIATLQRAIGIGHFVTTVCIPAWTDLPPGYIDGDVKESSEYYTFIRAVMLLYATMLLAANKVIAASCAWTANQLLRTGMPTSTLKETLIKQSQTCAAWMYARYHYDKGDFSKGALLMRHIPATTTAMPEWASIMLKTRELMSVTPTMEVLMAECGKSDKMIIGSDPTTLMSSLFPVIPTSSSSSSSGAHVTISTASKTTT